MESPTGIEDALEILRELLAARLHRVVHQHLGIAHDGCSRRAQFLPHVGNEHALRSPVGTLVNSIRHLTVSTHGAVAVAQVTLGLSKAAILPTRREISTGLVS